MAFWFRSALAMHLPAASRRQPASLFSGTAPCLLAHSVALAWHVGVSILLSAMCGGQTWALLAALCPW